MLNKEYFVVFEMKIWFLFKQKGDLQFKDQKFFQVLRPQEIKMTKNAQAKNTTIKKIP